MYDEIDRIVSEECLHPHLLRDVRDVPDLLVRVLRRVVVMMDENTVNLSGENELIDPLESEDE